MIPYHVSIMKHQGHMIETVAQRIRVASDGASHVMFRSLAGGSPDTRAYRRFHACPSQETDSV